MEFGTFMEFHTRTGNLQKEAFEESFNHAMEAESLGLNTIWLSESHFSPDRSVLSAPLIIASSIASRTKSVKIGTAVQVIPLSNPIRIAEEVATLDHIAGGRFEFGVGRSGLPRAYDGYGISYGESRDRFYESLEIIESAFTNDTFSYKGKFNSFENVCLTPKPLQNPHPKIRVAATTSDTFETLGEMGYPIFVGVRGLSLKDVANQVTTYVNSLDKETSVDIALRVPVHVAKTTSEALENAEDSFMKQFRRLGTSLNSSTKQNTSDSTKGRLDRSTELAAIRWEDVQGEKVAVGDPETVAYQLGRMAKELKLTSIIAEFNAGELLSKEKVKESLKHFCKEVIPNFD